MQGTEERDLTVGEALDFGCQMAGLGRHEEAIGLFKGVLMHEPSNFEAVQRVGISLFEMKRFHEALYWFWRGRKLDRKHPLALTNYGLCVGQLGHWEEALPDLERATYQLSRHPNLSLQAHALVYNNLGNTLEKLKRFDEALAACNKAVSYSPDESFAVYTRAVVLLRLNRHQEGLRALDHVIALKPDDADAHYNRGLARLLTGDFKGGFEDYEARMLTTEVEKPNFGLPASHKWRGEPLQGKRLLVHGEQGLGDYIQFLRFLPMLVEQGARVEIVVHTGIGELAGQILGVTVLPPRAQLTARHVKDGVEVDGYDHWVAMMSLPRLLGIEHESQIPAPFVPRIDVGRVERLAYRFRSKTLLNVGVCWAGNWMHKNDADRSIALQQFAALFDVPGVNFVSLQQLRPGDVAPFDKLKSKYADLRACGFDDLRDTAAMILSLDHVISVDTSIAHLSATLGVPTTILVPAFSTDWRWQLQREDSPWYPAARLVRQPKIGDWATPIEQLRKQLIGMAERKNAA